MEAGTLERLRASPLPVVLFVDHGWEGGVGRHIGELVQALEGRAHVVRLRPHGEAHVALEFGQGEAETMWFDAGRDWEAMVATLNGIGIDRVHFHHVHRLPMGVLDLPRACAAPHWVTLHDYYPACPAYHMKDAALRFCGGTPECRKCLDGGPAQWPLSLDRWRARFGDLLAQAERLIAPSQDAATRIRAFFPQAAPEVWPHPTDRDAAAAATARVLVPGAVSVEKGLDVLAACVRDASTRRLPLHFRVAGFLGRALPAWPDAPLSVSGQYPEGRLPELLALERGDAFFFPAQCPETFSYTLSAALATGKPIVAGDLGAMRERLEGVKDARVLPWDSPPQSFNDVLVQVTEAARAALPCGFSPTAGTRYAERYVSGLQRRKPSRTLAALDAASLAPPKLPPAQPSTLDWLFDDGVIAGKAASREELRQRLPRVDAELAGASARLAQAEARCAQLAASLAQLEQRLARQEAVAEQAQRAAAAASDRLRSLETSRSWRLLRPVRAIARWCGLTRTSG